MGSSTTQATALAMATKAHDGQKRASGEPYIEHPIAVAKLLQEALHADSDTIVAALLHDTVEDTDLTSSDIKATFGSDVERLVTGVTKVAKVSEGVPSSERNMQSIRKMFRVMGKDLRVIFIKLADRLHNMQTLGSLRKEKQQRIARETLEVYAPLADLLGIRDWHEELSDLAYKILEPMNYKLIARKWAQADNKQRRALEHWAQRLQTFLHSRGFAAVQVTLEPRHITGISRTTSEQPALLEHIETFYRVHVVTNREDHCYRILGLIHQFAALLPGNITDFIAYPKINGYRALHTKVISTSGQPVSVIIQTKDMLNEAKYGAALFYQMRGKKALEAKKLPMWVETLMSIDRGTADSPHFLQSVKTEIFGERSRVHIKGLTQRFVDVPMFASVLDAAYYLSKRNGNHVKSAIVNSEPCDLKHLVRDGDVIELTTDLRTIQRSARDLTITHTSLAQKFLTDSLASRAKNRLREEGKQLATDMVDVLIDPFFSSEARKLVLKTIDQGTHDYSEVGQGVINPFEVIEETCKPSDFFLLDPKCFTFSARMAPNPTIKFVLRTTVDTLEGDKLIGIHTRPDVIEVLSSEVDDVSRAPYKELVQLNITDENRIKFPFMFALKWCFTPDANPLKIIGAIQNMVETQLELLEFSSNCVTLGFHTDSIGMARVAYEHLHSLDSVTSIARTSP